MEKGVVENPSSMQSREIGVTSSSNKVVGFLSQVRDLFNGRRGTFNMCTIEIFAEGPLSSAYTTRAKSKKHHPEVTIGREHELKGTVDTRGQRFRYVEQKSLDDGKVSDRVCLWISLEEPDLDFLTISGVGRAYSVDLQADG